MITTLQDKIHIKHGFAFKGEFFSSNGKLMVLTPGNFHEKGGFRTRAGKEKFYTGKFPSDYLLKKGDLIVAMTEQGEGLLGSAAVIPASNSFLHNQRLGLISVDSSQLDIKFLYYLLNSYPVRQQIRNSSSGTKVRHTSPERIYQVQAWLPELSAQKKIAAILTAYDDLIETNNQRIQILENMAEEIYKEWFVRLRFPGHEAVKLVKGVPEGWRLKKLGDISEIKSSKRIYLKDYASTGIPFYRSKEVIEKSSGAANKTELFISRTKFEELDNKFGSPSAGDVLLTAVGTIGVSYLVTEEDKFYFKDGNLIWFQQKSLPSNQFLFMWLNTDFGKSKILEMTIGSSQAALTISGLKNVDILLPSEELIEKYINDFFEPINKQKNMLLQQRVNLVKTRDKLLPRLISGKLSVESLDINFPPSMEDALA